MTTTWLVRAVSAFLVVGTAFGSDGSNQRKDSRAKAGDGHQQMRRPASNSSQRISRQDSRSTEARRPARGPVQRPAEKAKRPSARATALAQKAEARRAASEARALEAERKRLLLESRKSTVTDVLARHRQADQKRAEFLKEYVENRGQKITEDKAYRSVSRKKSKAPKVKLPSFSPGRRQGVTRGKKRGSDYYNKIIRRAAGGRGGGRGGGRRNF